MSSCIPFCIFCLSCFLFLSPFYIPLSVSFFLSLSFLYRPLCSVYVPLSRSFSQFALSISLFLSISALYSVTRDWSLSSHTSCLAPHLLRFYGRQQVRGWWHCQGRCQAGHGCCMLQGAKKKERETRRITTLCLFSPVINVAAHVKHI